MSETCELCRAPLPDQYLGIPWAEIWVDCPACLIPPGTVTSQEALYFLVRTAAEWWTSSDTAIDLLVSLGHIRALLRHTADLERQLAAALADQRQAPSTDGGANE